MINTNPAVRKAVPYMLPFIHTPDLVATGMKLLNYKALRSLYPSTVPTALMNSLVDAWSQKNSVNTMVYWYPANFETNNIFSWSGFNSTIPYPLNIRVPTVVGWGMKDNIFEAAYNLPYLSQYVQQLKVSTYDQGSHFPETDVPAAIAADIRSLALKTAFAK
jgi:pimeloyl-ACP methyl ester carboxylesterase